MTDTTKKPHYTISFYMHPDNDAAWEHWTEQVLLTEEHAQAIAKDSMALAQYIRFLVGLENFFVCAPCLTVGWVFGQRSWKVVRRMSEGAANVATSGGRISVRGRTDGGIQVQWESGEVPTPYTPASNQPDGLTFCSENVKKAILIPKAISSELQHWLTGDDPLAVEMVGVLQRMDRGFARKLTDEEIREVTEWP